MFCGVESWLKEEHDGQKYTNQDGTLEEGEEGGWDSIHGRWYKGETLCSSGTAGVTPHFSDESPPDIVTLCSAYLERVDAAPTIFEPTDVINDPMPGRLYSLWNMLQSYTGTAFHEYTHTQWSGNSKCLPGASKRRLPFE